MLLVFFPKIICYAKCMYQQHKNTLIYIIIFGQFFCPNLLTSRFQHSSNKTRQQLKWGVDTHLPKGEKDDALDAQNFSERFVRGQLSGE